jgi:hypothetical protein
LQELPNLIKPLAEIKLASTQTLQQVSAKVQEANRVSDTGISSTSAQTL